MVVGAGCVGICWWHEVPNGQCGGGGGAGRGEVSSQMISNIPAELSLWRCCRWWLTLRPLMLQLLVQTRTVIITRAIAVIISIIITI